MFPEFLIFHQSEFWFFEASNIPSYFSCLGWNTGPLFLFFLVQISLGNDKVISVLSPLFIIPNWFPGLLTTELTLCGADSQGREKEEDEGMWITSPYPLPYSNFYFWHWCDTKNSLSWLLKDYSHTYLLIATQNMFSFWWNMHHPSKDSHKSSKHCMHEKAQIASGKLAACLQSALPGQSENKVFHMRCAGDYWLIFCVFLARYCLAVNAHLQDLCVHKTVLLTCCRLSVHEYSHRTQNHTTLLSTVVQPAMSMQLFRCIQLVIYPPAFCIGEISLEERVVGVGGRWEWTSWCRLTAWSSCRVPGNLWFLVKKC